ncbi:copper resistance CopC family protein [Brevibacterium sp. 'Marine']|uniref:copper resistance CopC family protein n=1 Tax=Brevibacterium sp. 'Marine' TaxID=2725563 RepID=UPI00145E1A58|nr:copper resistance CopC family protein [Brevibacterium sp. 'Marine']
MALTVIPRPTNRMLTVLALVLVAFLLPVAPASAHEAVTGTNPENGQKLSTAPEAIEISFSDTPLSMGSKIQITDSSGTNWAKGDVEIDGDAAVQPIKSGAPAGEYTVTWRVVSSDSHPIDGTFSFTATNGASTSSAPTPKQTKNDSSAPEPSQTETAQTADEEDLKFPASFIVVWILLFVAAVLVIVTLVLQQKHKRQ